MPRIEVAPGRDTPANAPLRAGQRGLSRGWSAGARGRPRSVPVHPRRVEGTVLRVVFGGAGNGALPLWRTRT